jgi:hypothetical protein
MADITMCVGGECPMKKICYRYTAKPNEHRQSIADFTKKWITIDGIPHCSEFVPDTKGDD